LYNPGVNLGTTVPGGVPVISHKHLWCSFLSGIVIAGSSWTLVIQKRGDIRYMFNFLSVYIEKIRTMCAFSLESTKATLSVITVDICKYVKDITAAFWIEVYDTFPCPFTLFVLQVVLHVSVCVKLTGVYRWIVICTTQAILILYMEIDNVFHFVIDILIRAKIEISVHIPPVVLFMIHHPPIMILECFVILYDQFLKTKKGLMYLFYLVFSMNDDFLSQDLVHFVMLITEMIHRHVMLTLKFICFLFNKKIYTSHNNQMSTSHNGF
jgi:hypothetical protein